MILFLSIAFQDASTVLSLRLFRVPRRHPWVFLIAGVLILMLWRRLITFINILAGNPLSPNETVYETIGLSISVFLFLSALLAVPRVMQFVSDKNELLEKTSTASRIISDLALPAFVIDKNHNVIHWNRACENLTGVPADDMLGTREPWKAFYHESRPVLADLVLEGATEEEIITLYGRSCSPSKIIEDGWETEFFLPALKDGKWLSFAAGPVKDSEGRVIGAIETFQDTTRHKNDLISSSEAARQMKILHTIIQEIAGEKSLESLMNRTVRLLEEKMSITIVSILKNMSKNPLGEPELRMIASSSTDASLYGQISDELNRSGKGLSLKCGRERRSILTPDVSVSQDFFQFVEGSLSEIDVPILDGDELKGVISMESSEVFTVRDEELFRILAGHLASLWRSIDLIHEKESMALTDQLTGLPNRRALFQRLEEEDSRLSRYGGNMSVIMADMTRFKYINDSYGHMMGDAAIKAAGECMQNCLGDATLWQGSAGTNSWSFFLRQKQRSRIYHSKDIRDTLRHQGQGDTTESFGRLRNSLIPRGRQRYDGSTSGGGQQDVRKQEGQGNPLGLLDQKGHLQDPVGKIPPRWVKTGHTLARPQRCYHCRSYHVPPLSPVL